MKHLNPDLHLTCDELLLAVIDPSDLDPTQQAHFKYCRHCRRLTDDLTHRYTRLGQMAKQMAPEPRQAFRVPAHNAPVGRWQFKPGIALGVLGVLIFVFTSWGPEFTRIHRTPTAIVVQHFENDDHLMEEIETLVEDALPVKYQQMAALSDDRSVGYLDELIDWVVPSPESADDLEQPAISDRLSRQESVARREATAHTERRMV